jgi:hypothetical protein
MGWAALVSAQRTYHRFSAFMRGWAYDKERIEASEALEALGVLLKFRLSNQMIYAPASDAFLWM